MTYLQTNNLIFSDTRKVQSNDNKCTRLSLFKETKQWTEGKTGEWLSKWVPHEYQHSNYMNESLLATSSLMTVHAMSLNLKRQSSPLTAERLSVFGMLAVINRNLSQVYQQQLLEEDNSVTLGAFSLLSAWLSSDACVRPLQRAEEPVPHTPHCVAYSVEQAGMYRCSSTFLPVKRTLTSRLAVSRSCWPRRLIRCLDGTFLQVRDNSGSSALPLNTHTCSKSCVPLAHLSGCSVWVYTEWGGFLRSWLFCLSDLCVFRSGKSSSCISAVITL